MQEHAVIEKDLSLYYKITGQGLPVMLVHGFGEDSTVWDPLIPQLKKENKLFIPDLLGSGRSTGNIEGVTMESLADHLNMIAEKENLNRFVMIGHSMGGYITLAYAEKYPFKLTSFGLFHSTAFPDSDEKKEVRKKNIEFIKKHGAEIFLEQAIPKLFSEEYRKENPEIVKEFIDRYRNFSATSLVCYTEAMMNRPDRTNVLKGYKEPILFIFGEYDTAIPLEQGLKQCKIPEFSYIYIAAHSGHMGMLEEQDFCLKAIQDFLTQE